MTASEEIPSAAPPRPLPHAGEAPRRLAAPTYLRLAAAGVIVLFHSHAPGGEHVRTAVAVFMAFLGCFAVRLAGLPPGEVARRRADRLLRPFAIWATVAVLLRLGDELVSGGDPAASLLRWLPPEGTMSQLWFLPFAFVATLAIRALAGAIDLGRPAVALPLAAAAAALVLPLEQRLGLAPGLAVYVTYLPALFLGIGLAGLLGRPGPLVLLAAASLAAAWLADLALPGHGTLRLAAGVALAALSLALPARAGGTARLVGALSVALYLVHCAVLPVALRLLPWPQGSAALGLAVILASAVGGLVLLRLPYGRRLF